MKFYSRYCAVVACALLTIASSGCAAVKATQQPDKRDMKVLDRGVPRTHVIAELGAPVWSDQPGDASVDVFKFKQGYTKTTKAARALVHGAADVATLGLWEVVGIPAESIADGTDVQVEVHYAPDRTVDHVVVIKGEKAVHPPKFLAFKRRAGHKISGEQSKIARSKSTSDENPTTVAASHEEAVTK
jgi:hypothetical protein